MVTYISVILLLNLCVSAYEITQLVRIPSDQPISLDRLQLFYQFNLTSASAMTPDGVLCSDDKENENYIHKLNLNLSICIQNSSCQSVDWDPLDFCADCKGEECEEHIPGLNIQCHYTVDSSVLKASVSAAGIVDVSTRDIPQDSEVIIKISDIVPAKNALILSINQQVYEESKSILSNFINMCRPPCIASQIEMNSFGYHYDEDSGDPSNHPFQNLSGLLIFYETVNHTTDGSGPPCADEGQWRSIAIAFIVLFILLIIVLITIILYRRFCYLKKAKADLPSLHSDSGMSASILNQKPPTANPYASQTLVMDGSKPTGHPGRPGSYEGAQPAVEDDHIYSKPFQHEQNDANPRSQNAVTNNNVFRVKSEDEAHRDIVSYVEILP